MELSYNFLPSDEDALHDRSPVRDRAAHRQNVRGNRGRGRGGRGRGGCVARPRDPELEWSRTYNPPADRPFVEPPPGPTQRYPADTRAGAFFDQMFTDDIWDMIVKETNGYHDRQAASQPNKHKRKWDPVTKHEMEAFIGIVIHMGNVKFPRMTIYWSTDNLVHQESELCNDSNQVFPDLEVLSLG